MLSKKDIIAINKEFDKGIFVNESSLDYVLDATKRSNNWLKTVALLVRAILIDHVFSDGNKRTAAAIIFAFFDMNNFDYDQDAVTAVVLEIIKKNVNDVRKIARLIKNVIN